LIAVLSGLFLFWFHGTQIATLFIVTIIAFIASDFLTPLFMRGGNGICQVTANGNLTIPEGYGFLAFFGTILGLTLLVNEITDNISSFWSIYIKDFWANLAIGTVLSGLVYLDLFVKFYKHKKKN
jgi:hypothetical protein